MWLQVRGRLKEAAEKKRLEKERKEVPDEVKEKFKEWNKWETLFLKWSQQEMKTGLTRIRMAKDGKWPCCAKKLNARRLSMKKKSETCQVKI